MRIRRLGFAALALIFVAGSTPSAGVGDKPLILHTSWQLSLDAAGHVVDLSTRDPVNPTLKEALEHHIRHWEFVSGKLDGTPQATETTLWLKIEFTPEASTGKYLMRIADVDSGPAIEPSSKRIPKYPPSMLKRKEQGVVVLILSYDADGKVQSAVPSEAAPAAHPVLVKTAVAALLQWQLVPERVAGHGLPGRVMVPVCFLLRRHAACQYTPPGSKRAAQSEQPLNLTAVTQLKTDVIGQML